MCIRDSNVDEVMSTLICKIIPENQSYVFKKENSVVKIKRANLFVAVNITALKTRSVCGRGRKKSVTTRYFKPVMCL